MHTTKIADNHDAQGMVLVLVLCLMAVLFLLGTAALNNITTEYKTSYNYMQSVQAFNDAEAGIGEAVGTISANLDHVFGTPINASSGLFQYNYTIFFDPNYHIYTIISQGYDPTKNAMRQITAEYLSIFNPPVVDSPVFCSTGDFTGANADCNIIGNPNCPPYAMSYYSDDSPVACVSTPTAQTTGIGYDDDFAQLITDHTPAINFSSRPGIDFNKVAAFYKGKEDFDDIDAVDKGTQDDFKLGYVINSGTELNVNSDFEGYGVLILEGDFMFSGQVVWHGLIISLGNVQFIGTGTHLYGAVLSSGDCNVAGDAKVKWCPGTIRKALQDLYAPPLELLSWKED
ncbi:MAG: PilX N-terminal domain-containing pilus assembly protein [bacterium]